MISGMPSMPRLITTQTLTPAFFQRDNRLKGVISARTSTKSLKRHTSSENLAPKLGTRFDMYINRNQYVLTSHRLLWEKARLEQDNLCHR
jgi:hypothetical protein